MSNKSDDTFRDVATYAASLGMSYATHVAGASFPVATGAVFLAENTVKQQYESGKQYVQDYTEAKSEYLQKGMSERDASLEASRYASLLDPDNR